MKRVRLPGIVLVWFLAVVTSIGVRAEKQDPPAEPGEIVSTVTEQLLVTVKDNAALLESDPEKYFSKVRALLEPVIDFESIAKNVMGRKSWTSVEKPVQDQFVNVFTDSLVRTYGKAMASFVDLDIKVAKTWPSDNPKKKNHYVQQDVKLEGGLAHIVYNMSPVGDSWKVRNVIIRDAKGYKLNMGKTFYSQFKHTLEENDGDVQAAIGAWGKQ